MLSESELKSLGVRIKNREAAAYHLLYTEFFADLRAYAYRFVYDYSEAEDMVQEAYLSLWKNIRFYQPEQNVLHYLLAIVRNQCYNYLRHLRIQDEHHDKLIEAVIFSGMEDPEVDEEMRRRLHEVLGRLSPKGRSILLRHVLKQEKVKDIASDMGIAESSVKTHLKRAMRILRDNLCFILLGC